MKNDGGPAFPFIDEPRGMGTMTYTGMSLRDYFAAAALTGFCASFADYTPMRLINDKGFAEDCYALADAMIAQRTKDAIT